MSVRFGRLRASRGGGRGEAAERRQFITTTSAYARKVCSSIMGRAHRGIRTLLGDGAAIVRAMPNTPAAVRQGNCGVPGGVTLASGLCERLLQASVYCGLMTRVA